MYNHALLNKRIGQAIKEARKSKRITQEQLAKITGMSRSTITHYELGNIEISMPNFILICNAIGVDYASLLQSVEVPKFVNK